MQKYVSFMSQLENRQNEQTSTAFELSTDNNEISFDQLLQKSEDNTSPYVDHVFKQIEINVSSKNLKQKQEKEKEKTRKLSLKEKNEEIAREREQFNRKLDQKLSKSRQRYKEKTVNIQAQKEQRQQICLLQKENEELKETILKMQSEIQQLHEKLSQQNEQVNQKLANVTKEAKFFKSQLDRIDKQKESNVTKAKNLMKKIQKGDEKVEELQKKLRVKQKQMKKMEELQEERSNYYQSLFEAKQGEIQKVRSQLMKKSKEIYDLNQNYSKNEGKAIELMKQLEKVWQVNKQLECKMEENSQVIERINNMLQESVFLMQQHLKQPLEKTSNYSSIRRFSSQYKTTGRKAADEGYFKYFLSLVMQIIERNKAILNRKETQIKNFQGVYEVQLEDLDKKMSYLIEENKHLKVKNQEINKTYAPSIKQPIFHPIHTTSIKQPSFHTSQGLKKYMSTQKLNHPKIKEDVLSSKTVQVLQQIQRARKMYKETSTRIETSSFLKQRGRESRRDRCQSQSNLLKRSRRSLSWKKPAEILKQYI